MNMKLLAAVAVIAASMQAPAEPEPVVGAQMQVLKCKVCDGSGRLVRRPPDHGQYAGRIEPKSHWDLRLACPFCKGKGRQRVYRTAMQPLKEGPPPCASCGWTGVERCRVCSASGAVRCRATDCRNGWVVTRRQVSSIRRSSAAEARVSVTPCHECGGVGKVPCAACDGLRATLCRRCNGRGRGKEK